MYLNGQISIVGKRMILVLTAKPDLILVGFSRMIYICTGGTELKYSVSLITEPRSILGRFCHTRRPR